MAKERIAYIDFMKGLCILLIVVGHVNGFSYDSILPNLNNALRSFRVPMYFFLSGLFFKTNSGFDEFLRKKVNNLIVTLLFFHFFCCIGWFLLEAIVNGFHLGIAFHFPISYVIPSFFGRYWFAAVALWFLVALFGVNMLYYLFQHYLSRSGVIIAVVLCSIAGYGLMKCKIELPLELDITLVGLPFFMLGSMVNQLGLMKPSKYDKYGLIVLIPSAFLVYRFSGDIDLLYQTVPNYFLLYLIPFIAILSLFWFCKNLSYIPLVCHYGRYSIILLGTHQLLIGYIGVLLQGLTGIEGRNLVIATIVLLLLVELAVIWIMVKCFPRFTAQKAFFKEGWKVT